MSEAVHIYTLLGDACALLDSANDHAIAAYVGLAMALMEEKYGIDPATIAASTGQDGIGSLRPSAGQQENGGSWA